MKNRTTIFWVLLGMIVSCGNPNKDTSDEINLIPYTGHVTFVKEYVDSVEKFIFYDSIDVTIGVYGYQFTYFSDSVFDPRVNRIISRNNSFDISIYKTNSSKDTLYSISPSNVDNDTLRLVKTTTFDIDTIEITIKKYISISEDGSALFFSDKYGLIEISEHYPNRKDFRLKIESTNILSNKQLLELQQKLRTHKMYWK